MLKVTECGQQFKNITLLRQAFFEPVFELRQSRQFAKAENKKIEGEVRKFPTSLDKKTFALIGETKLCYQNESQQNITALQHCCNVVATLFRTVVTLFQNCDVLLR